MYIYDKLIKSRTGLGSNGYPAARGIRCSELKGEV